MNVTNTLKTRLSLLFLFLTSTFFTSLIAQIEFGGQPFSLQQDHAARFKEDVSIIQIKNLNMDLIKKEDEALVGTVRFAAPMVVDMDIYEDGFATVLENGDVVYRLKVQASNALGLYFLYDNFRIPHGGQLFMYDEFGEQLKGSYTYQNNPKSGLFMTGMIKGNTAIIEYYEPANVAGQANIHINKVMQAYHAENLSSDYEFNALSSSDFGEALDCNVNINCSLGNNLQLVKKGVTRISRVFEEGIGWCTGSLVNNTALDGTPYVLSAYHCIVGFTPQYELWRFDFNFEAPECDDPETEPSFQSLLGCSLVAGREESDFSLFLLDHNVPASYDPFFNGWNNSPTYTPTSLSLVHHPRGDVKKLALETNQPNIHNSAINWSNGVITPANHHFRGVLDDGIIEPGSSGCPFFDNQGLIVAQLHGGSSSCTAFTTYGGRFAMSWDAGTDASTRLMEWLDPTNSGETTLAGFVPPSTGVSINGMVDNEAGAVVSSVEVKVNDIWSFTTNTNGNYYFEALETGDSYTVTPRKTSMPINGVTTLDLVIIQQHILNIAPFTTTEKLIAADANNSGTVTTFDLVVLKQLILTIYDELPDSDSWRFDPPSITVDPLLEDQFDLNFRAIKIGDVNGTADPGL